MPTWWSSLPRRWQDMLNAKPGESRGHAEMRARRRARKLSRKRNR